VGMRNDCWECRALVAVLSTLVEELEEAAPGPRPIHLSGESRTSQQPRRELIMTADLLDQPEGTLA
jgi:hypothetical protein